MTYAEIVQAIGTEAADQLIDALGGVRCYIPLHPGAAHRLTLLLGAEVAARLAARMGGEVICVPRPPRRARRIRDLAARGMRKRDIALAVGCTTEWVRRVLSGTAF